MKTAQEMLEKECQDWHELFMLSDGLVKQLTAERDEARVMAWNNHMKYDEVVAERDQLAEIGMKAAKECRSLRAALERCKEEAQDVRTRWIPRCDRLQTILEKILPRYRELFAYSGLGDPEYDSPIIREAEQALFDPIWKSAPPRARDEG